MTDPTTSPADRAAQQTEQQVVDLDYLDLDEMLDGKIYLAEKTGILYTKPHLEARIDALEVELEKVTIGATRPDPHDEAAVGDAPAQGDRAADDIAKEIEAVRREYAASGRKVVLRQLPSTEWTAFEAQWKKALDAGAPYPPAMWNDLISKCAVKPEMPLAKVEKLRDKFGHPPLHRLALTAWQLNTEAGVTVPFSQLSSPGRALGRRGMS